MSAAEGQFYTLGGSTLNVAPPSTVSADGLHTVAAWTIAFSLQEKVPEKLIVLCEISMDDPSSELPLEKAEHFLDFSKYGDESNQTQ